MHPFSCLGTHITINSLWQILQEAAFLRFLSCGACPSALGIWAAHAQWTLEDLESLWGSWNKAFWVRIKRTSGVDWFMVLILNGPQRPASERFGGLPVVLLGDGGRMFRRWDGGEGSEGTAFKGMPRPCFPPLFLLTSWLPRGQHFPLLCASTTMCCLGPEQQGQVTMGWNLWNCDHKRNLSSV